MLPACGNTFHFLFSHVLTTESSAIHTFEKAGAGICCCQSLAPKTILINGLVPAYSFAHDSGFQYKEPASSICTTPVKKWPDEICLVKAVLASNQAKCHTLHYH